MKARANTSYQRTKRSRMGVTSTMYTNSRLYHKNAPTRPEYSLDDFRQWCYAQDIFDVIFDAWEDSGYEDSLKPSLYRLDINYPHQLDNIALSVKGFVKRKADNPPHTKEHLAEIKLCEMISRVPVMV